MAISCSSRLNAASPYKPFGTLRFTLALMVLGQHFCEDIAPDFIRQTIFPYAPGNIAVLGFFILSGFIICEAYHYNYRGRPFAYMQNRFMRIIPGYWAALICSLLAHYMIYRHYGHVFSLDRHSIEGAHFGALNIIKNFVAVIPPTRVNQTSESYLFIPYSFALQTEMIFYLTVFSVGFAYLFIKQKIEWPEDYWLALAGYLGITAALLSQLGFLPRQLGYAGYFAFGGSLFFLLQGYRKAWLVLLPAFAQIMWHFHSYSAEDFTVITANRPGQLFILAIIITAIIILAATRIRLTMMDKRLGDLSYPIYLNHYVVAVIILNTTSGPSVGILCAGVLASLALSFAMFVVVEKPLFRIRRYIRENGSLFNVKNLSF